MFIVNLTNATNATIADGTGTATIVDDDDPAPVVGDISIGDVILTEGTGGSSSATFTVTRSNGTAAFSVSFDTADGTATAGLDYNASSDGIGFAAGETTKTISIMVNPDALDEPNETFSVVLSNPTGPGATIVDGTGIATIVDDDDPAPVVGNISIGDVILTEGTGGSSNATFTVTRSNGTAAFSVSFDTADGTATAGLDYNASSDGIGFAAGETTKTISISVNPDAIDEPNETFSVVLSNPTGPGATIVDGTGIATIVDDDDPAPVVGDISIGDVILTEGTGGSSNATFTVTRSNGTAAFSVSFDTADGTATAGLDYNASSDGIGFAAGETTKTISILVNPDAIDEPNETFSLVLSNPTGPGATIVDGTGIATIVDDDDPAPVVGDISIGDVILTEGTGGSSNATFTVTRSNGTAAFSVSFDTADGTATAGLDYNASSDGIGFLAGETTKTISILVNPDAIDEPNETFSLVLSNPTGPGANIVDGTGIATIVDDDAAAGGTTTLTATFTSESAGYRSSFGWYDSATGLGGILFGDIEAGGSSSDGHARRQQRQLRGRHRSARQRAVLPDPERRQLAGRRPALRSDQGDPASERLLCDRQGRCERQRRHRRQRQSRAVQWGWCAGAVLGDRQEPVRCRPGERRVAAQCGSIGERHRRRSDRRHPLGGHPGWRVRCNTRRRRLQRRRIQRRGGHRPGTGRLLDRWLAGRHRGRHAVVHREPHQWRGGRHRIRVARWQRFGRDRLRRPGPQPRLCCGRDQQGRLYRDAG